MCLPMILQDIIMSIDVCHFRHCEFIGVTDEHEHAVQSISDIAQLPQDCGVLQICSSLVASVNLEELKCVCVCGNA